MNEPSMHTQSVTLAPVDEAAETLLNFEREIRKALERAIVLTQRAISLLEDQAPGEARAELKKIAKALRSADLSRMQIPQATHDLATEAIAHGKREVTS